MPLKPERNASIVDICWACSGTGVRFKSIAPLAFRTCPICNGAGGKRAYLWSRREEKQT